MQRADAGKIRDLLPAGRSGCNEDLALRQTSGRGQETALANPTRHVEVLARIPERSSHSAAARVQIADADTRDPLEQRLRRCYAAHRLLMTMPVQDDACRTVPERQRVTPGGATVQEFLEGDTAV